MAKKQSKIVIDWIEKHLFIPEGAGVGKPFKLVKFQKEIIETIYDNPHGTRRAIISMARKSAKSTLTAALAIVHLVGPLAKRNSSLYCAARTRDQAGILYKLACKMILQSPSLMPFLRINETKKMITCPDLGTTFQALSSDAKSQLGLSPVWVAFDEIGAVRGPQDELYDALESAMAAQEAPLSICLSTQAPSPDDLLSMLIDDALTGADPTTVVKLYACPEDVDPFSPEALTYHPAWDSFVNKKELKGQQAAAKRLPSLEPAFRNYQLNQRIEATAPFINRTIWDECKGSPEDYEGQDLYLALDLSVTADLTACLALYRSEDTKPWSVKPFFYLPDDGIEDKSRDDRIPWNVWKKTGYLTTTPGRVISYDWVAAQLMELSNKAKIVKIAFDRYGFNHFKPALIRAGFTEEWIEETFEPFGQGFVSMSPAIRQLEEMILKTEIAHGGNPILTMNMNNIKVISDPAGNRKFVKHTGSKKIDGAVCLAMASGLIQKIGGEKPKTQSYLSHSPLLILN
ncbi:terminase large subunit [Pseudogemmobacter bohemicus]|uniref:terminase large subunit n=1 Tax=Pseudogemmobacter bohemicus TaxID=2250708 RepID=UPI000DD4381A|nr:terminase TerL endonuclease subunit [Pseudogemmobacter bohemicus]